MVTRAGERRRLYADAALSKGLTTNTPLSPLGLDWMESMFWAILRACVGPSNNDLQPKDALFFFAGCRMYVNYSNLMRSEEHTSELQSLMRISYAVFCLKKKKTTKEHTK